MILFLQARKQLSQRRQEVRRAELGSTEIAYFQEFSLSTSDQKLPRTEKKMYAKLFLIDC